MIYPNFQYQNDATPYPAQRKVATSPFVLRPVPMSALFVYKLSRKQF